MSHTLLFTSLVLIQLSSTTFAVSANWPQWRGPQANGVAADGEYPVEFSPMENVLWKEELPGCGSSTPAVWGDRILVTCQIDGEDGVCAYDFDGLKIWQRHLGQGRKGEHQNATGSNPSPVTNGKYIIVYFKSGSLACLDFSGETRWRVNLQELYGKDTLWWDIGTSPVIAAGNAVVAVMQDGDSYLVAFDLKSGDLAWKQSRIYETATESDQSYTTPYVTEVDGREMLITWGANHLTGHDAISGELVWECGGFNPEDEGMWRVIASPAVDSDIAVVPYGRGNFLAGIKLRGDGDVTKTNRAWEKQGLGTDVPTPVIRDDKVFLLTDNGKVACLDKMTGDEMWSEDLPKSSAKYYASPILAGKHLYCAREDGVIMVAEVGDGLKLLTENELDEKVVATPVPLRGKLLVRSENHLYMFGK